MLVRFLCSSAVLGLFGDPVDVSECEEWDECLFPERNVLWPENGGAAGTSPVVGKVLGFPWKSLNAIVV